MTVPIIISYGQGWDSSAILLQWLSHPESRDFDLADLIVVSAQTGDESRQTREFVEREMFPRLRAAGVRTVQVARGGLLEADGIVVLSDTREPITCHTDGVYRLSDELLRAGTVPQYASGRRRCTLKFKGWVLDRWIEREMGDRVFRHVMGFNADEMRRVEKDRSFSNVQRRSEYPLVEWGWGREQLEAFVNSIAPGCTKSCCTFCPFAGGKAPMLAKYRRHPDEGAFAVFLEHVSLALNPRMALYSSGSVRDAIKRDGNTEALRLADERLSACEWALYNVRRIYYAKGVAWRSIKALARGTRSGMEAKLRGDPEAEAGPGGMRYYRYRRGEEYPTREAFFIAAPATVADKERPSFGRKWTELSIKEETA